jgi:hypothetical protein
MLFCAVFFGWAGVLPRETISGFIGRKASNTHWIWKAGERFINWMHPHEPGHCFETYQCESKMRERLYS